MYMYGAMITQGTIHIHSARSSTTDLLESVISQPILTFAKRVAVDLEMLMMAFI